MVGEGGKGWVRVQGEGYGGALGVRRLGVVGLTVRVEVGRGLGAVRVLGAAVGAVDADVVGLAGGDVAGTVGPIEHEVGVVRCLC